MLGEHENIFFLINRNLANGTSPWINNSADGNSNTSSLFLVTNLNAMGFRLLEMTVHHAWD